VPLPGDRNARGQEFWEMYCSWPLKFTWALAPTLVGAWMIIAGGAGLSMVIWYLLVGRRLLQLGAHLER
jgi:hypothetical protein